MALSSRSGLVTTVVMLHTYIISQYRCAIQALPHSSSSRLSYFGNFTIQQQSPFPTNLNLQPRPTIMAMAHRSATFPLFSSLPAELRLLIFEQALLPLIEPRIVAVYKDMNDRDADDHLLGGFFSFMVINRSFLNANDSFIASAATIRQVCTESRDVVQSFCSRFDLPAPQPALESRRFSGSTFKGKYFPFLARNNS